jgi:hypothetical protein
MQIYQVCRAFHPPKATERRTAMLSNNPTEPQASAPADTKNGTAKASPAVLDPRSPIEVSSGGGGTVNDPPGADIKPPCSGGFEIPAW